MEMEVKAVVSVVIQKLAETVANSNATIRQQSKIHKSLKKLQTFLEENDVSEMSIYHYLCVLYEFEDVIEKFSFRVARREKKMFKSLLNRSSCRLLIRKINKILAKVSCSREHVAAAATPSFTMITSSSTVWPIPPIASHKRACLTRSLSTIPQMKKLTSSYSNKSYDVSGNIFYRFLNEVVMIRDYNNLRFELKVCLLYLTSFPEDFDIPVRRLLRRWVAEGFVSRRSGQLPYSPEDLVQKHFEELVNQGMIKITKLRSDNSPKKCRLVSVLHDYLSPKAQNTGLFCIYNNLVNFGNAAGPFGVRRMVHQMGHAATSAYCATKFDPSLLRGYVSFNPQCKDTPAKEVGVLLNSIIKNKFCLLTVLDLEGVNKPVLPDKLGLLSVLKYLGLRRTNLDSLPDSVGDLMDLETLDVKHTNVDILPKSIGKLKKLRHLNLNNIRLAMPPSSSLTLVTLWGLVLDENIPVTNGLNMLLNLKELGIKFHLTKGSQDLLQDWIAKLVKLESMRLISVDDMGRVSNLVLKPLVNLDKLSHLNLIGNLERLPCVNEFPPMVKVLTLSISRLNDDPMETLEQLPFLMVLRLLGDSFTGKRMVCHRGGFKKLQVLKLWKMEGLEEWDVEEEAMESLKQLDIRSCHKLKTISCRLLLKPKPLEEIIVTKMPDDFVSRIDNRKSTHTSLILTKIDGSENNDQAS